MSTNPQKENALETGVFFNPSNHAIFDELHNAYLPLKW